MLIVARVCQGLSGAVIGVLGLAMIADKASPENIGEFMAYSSLSFTWGMLIGPVLGGLLYVISLVAVSQSFDLTGFCGTF